MYWLWRWLLPAERWGGELHGMSIGYLLNDDSSHDVIKLFQLRIGLVYFNLGSNCLRQLRVRTVSE